MAVQPISQVPEQGATHGQSRWPQWRHVVDWLLIGGVALVLIWLTVAAWSELGWFLVGLVIYELLLPLVNRMARVMPRWLAALLGVLLVLGLVVGSIAVLVPPLLAESEQLSAGFPTSVQLQQAYAVAYHWYAANVPAATRAVLDNAAGQLYAQASANLRGLLASAGAQFVGLVQRLVALAASLLGFVIALVWLYQLWSARASGVRLLRAALPPPLRRDGLNLFWLFHRVFVRYLRSQIVLSLIASVLIWLAVSGLNLLGYHLRSALLLALVAGLARFIPYAGGIIGTIPAVLLALLGPERPLEHALVVFAVYQVIYNVEGYVIEPQITGTAINIAPAVLTPLVIMGAAVFGVAGAVLAAPIAALARDWCVYLHRRLNGTAPRVAYRSLTRPRQRRHSTRPG